MFNPDTVYTATDKSLRGIGNYAPRQMAHWRQRKARAGVYQDRPEGRVQGQRFDCLAGCEQRIEPAAA